MRAVAAFLQRLNTYSTIEADIIVTARRGRVLELTFSLSRGFLD